MAYDRENYPYPTAAGRYCEWAHKSVDKSMESETFEKFMETLRLECDQGEPAYLNWTVPMDTPDLLYYQVGNIYCSPINMKVRVMYCFVMIPKTDELERAP